VFRELGRGVLPVVIEEACGNGPLVVACARFAVTAYYCTLLEVNTDSIVV
jgi:hypothetical protein